MKERESQIYNILGATTTSEGVPGEFSSRLGYGRRITEWILSWWIIYLNLTSVQTIVPRDGPLQFSSDNYKIVAET